MASLPEAVRGCIAYYLSSQVETIQKNPFDTMTCYSNCAVLNLTSCALKITQKKRVRQVQYFKMKPVMKEISLTLFYKKSRSEQEFI